MHTKMIEQNIKMMLPRQDDNGRFRGLILSGRGGIGKTQISMNLIPNAPVVRMTCGSRSFETFGTYPCPIKSEVITENGTTQTVELKNLVIEEDLLSLAADKIGDEYAIAVFDDVTLADERLQSAILEIVQFGRIGDVLLGKNVLPVMTGNTVQDGCFATEWSKALLGRCQLIHFEPNFDQWLAAECNSNLDPSVIAFLKDNPQFFAPAVSDEKCVDQHGKAPCPRDWTALGNFFSSIGGYKNYSPNFLYANAGSFCRAAVGEKAGDAFASYTKIFGVYPDTESLFKKPELWKSVDSEKRKMLSGAMGVAFGLRSYFKNEIKKAKSKENKEKMINDLWDVVLVIAQDHREIIAFVFSHLLTWSCSADVTVGGLIAKRMGKESIQDENMRTLLQGFKAYNQSEHAA